jgi:hypothetical protein
MKRSLFLSVLIAGAFLACAPTAVFAQTATLRLQAGNCLAQVDSGAHANGYGYVVIKPAKGGYDVTWLLWNAAPSYSYFAKKPGGTQADAYYLTTDATGRGSLTVHVTTKPRTWGPWIGLREKDGELSKCPAPLPPVDQWQGLWAAANPYYQP